MGLASSRLRAEIESLAAEVPDNGGVYLVPAFAGLGAPYWDPYARGAIIGLTRGTKAAHIARAALESMAFQTAEVLDAMHADSGLQLKELRVDGGASVNNTLMQFQADVLGVPVVRPGVSETTALGRRLPGRSGRWLLEGSGGDRKAMERGTSVQARHGPRGPGAKTAEMEKGRHPCPGMGGRAFQGVNLVEARRVK